jgi:hypothetical protein
VSHRGPTSWSALHRKRDPTPRTREIADPHTAILQHLHQSLCKTVWTDIMLRETCKRIDRRTTVQGREFILASPQIGAECTTRSRHRTHSDPHVARVPSTCLRPCRSKNRTRTARSASGHPIRNGLLLVRSRRPQRWRHTRAVCGASVDLRAPTHLPCGETRQHADAVKQVSPLLRHPLAGAPRTRQRVGARAGRRGRVR